MTKDVYIPESLQINETFLLKDIAWSFLFPTQWFQYQRKASKRNVAKLKVLDKDNFDNYTVELMEISPAEEGRLIVPVGIRATVPFKTIQIAMMSAFVVPNSTEVEVEESEE